MGLTQVIKKYKVHGGLLDLSGSRAESSMTSGLKYSKLQVKSEGCVIVEHIGDGCFSETCLF